MSVNAQKMLSSNENNKKNDKTLRPLFPKQAAECSYVSCYWCVHLTLLFCAITSGTCALLWFLFFSARKMCGNYVKMYRCECLRSWIDVSSCSFRTRAVLCLCGNKELGGRTTVSSYGCVPK